MTSEVYRYLFWDKNEKDSDIIKTKTIKLNNPDAWKADYAEWSLPFDWDNVPKEVIDQKVRIRATSELLSKGLLNGGNLKSRKKELENQVQFYNPKNRRETEQNHIDRLKQYVGAFCTSTTIDSLQMWEGWGHVGYGYAVGLNVQELVKNPNLNGLNKEVNYYSIGNIPRISPLSSETIDDTIKNFELQLFSIPEINKFEKEYRFTKLNIKDETLMPYSEADRLVELSRKSYTKIIFGYKMRSSDINELLGNISEDLKDLPIFQAKKVGGNIEIKKYET